MNINEIKKNVIDLFEKEKIEVNGESGFLINGRNDVKRIGYATNLTPNVIEKAIEHKIDLIITHHDAWEFVYGMKEYCVEKLRENVISHFFVHLPLDDCEFGTNVSFLNRLGTEIIQKLNLQEKFFYCGRIGELSKEIDFEELVLKVEDLLGEKVKHWKNNNKKIKRVGFLSGAGFSTSDMKEFVENGCDVFITGEKILYTIQYAEFTGINLIVGSHTYTELPGVEALCKKIKEKYSEIEIMRIDENHNE